MSAAAFAIRHTFPDGRSLGLGLITSGDTRPAPVRRFTLAEAEDAVERMRGHNPGHGFEIVPAPAAG